MKFSHLSIKDYLLVTLFFLVGFLTRLPLIEKFQSHWDGSLFSIAVVNYSIIENTPPKPGHPLYIAFGKFFNLFIQDPHAAILFVSVLFSGLSAAAFYFAGKTIFNKSSGVIAALIFLSGSTFYYFGLTPYSFVMLPFSWCLLAASIFLYVFKKKNTSFFIGAIYAFALGVRPQEGLFITPLVLYSLYFMPRIDRIKSFAAFCAFFLLWFTPLIFSQGIEEYFSIMTTNLPNYPLGFKQQDLELIFKDYFLSLGVAGLILPYYLVTKTRHISKNKKVIVFFLIWILPSLFFNFLLTSVHAGYQMDYLIALVLLSSFATYEIFKRRKMLLTLVVFSIVISNLAVFFWNRDPNYTKPYRPTSFHYSDVRKNDLKLGSKVKFIKEKFDPSQTLILTVSTLWSPYMYHLKEYRQYSIESLFTDNPKFKDTRRDSLLWKVREYERSEHNLSVPNNINKILLVDDEINFDLRGMIGVKHRLPGNSSVIEIAVKEGQTIKYGYHSLER